MTTLQNVSRRIILVGMIGRGAELREMEQLLSDARARQGRMIFLIGEEGVGKSCLVTEVADRALTAGMRVTTGRASTLSPVVPLRPFAEAAIGLCRTSELARTGSLGTYRHVFGHFIPDFSDSRYDGGTPSPVVIGEALLKLTAAAGCEHGCLIILDSLHNADQKTLAVLEYLADNFSGQPAMIIVTLRAEPRETYNIVHDIAWRARSMIIRLNRLCEDEIRQIAASCLKIPPPEVDDDIVSILFRDSDGNPMITIELLHEMLGRGLITAGSGKLLEARKTTGIPRAVAYSLSHRAARLGPHGKALYQVAAVFGRSFPAAAVQVITGLDDEALFAHLDAGVVSGFVTPARPDWYSFSLPLAPQALLQQLTPTSRARLAGRAVEAMTALHPGLPGEWCQRAARVLIGAGDTTGAARLLANAGLRALSAGMLGSAAVLLDQALHLAGERETSLRASILEALLGALTETGEIASALQFGEIVDELAARGADHQCLVALYTRLGWVAAVAGRWLQASRHMRTARDLLGTDLASEQAVSVDALAAYIAVNDTCQGSSLATTGKAARPNHRGEQYAAELARRAVERSQQADLPTTGCQAWLTLGMLALRRDPAFAATCFESAHALAVEQRLPVQRLRAGANLGFCEWLIHADASRLEQTRRYALRLGAKTICGEIDAIAGMTHVLGGRYFTAAKLIDLRCTEAKQRHLTGTAQHTQLARAILAAHQGARREMEAALTEFRRLGGGQTDLVPLALGLAQVFCSLLEEETERSREEMAEAISSGPARYPLAGQYGLQLLLGVLSGKVGWREHEQASAAPAGGIRWNLQFTMFARAVLLGQEARTGQAIAALAEAEEVAAPFPLCRYLSLRLVAEAAIAARWGEPADWLRRAEAYFYAASILAPARACRDILRGIGECVPQRRHGTGTIPPRIRLQGVTLREYETLQLLAGRSGNKTIADELHISVRTVEKHVASLRIKLGLPDRFALCRFAATL